MNLEKERKAIDKARAIRATRDGRTMKVNELIKFVTMSRRGAPDSQFRMALDILPGDVQRIKGELGLVTSRDHDIVLQRLEKLKTGDVTDAPEQMLKGRVEPTQERASDAELTMPTKSTNPMKTLEEKQYARILANIKKMDEAYREFSIPEREQSKFIRGWRLGKRFWSTAYNVPPILIIREYKRLIPDIKIEDIPS